MHRSLPASLVAAASAAAAGGASAAPAVPLYVQGLIAQRAGDLAYVPTRLPAGYRYGRFQVARGPTEVVLRFVRARPGGVRPTWFVVRVRRQGAGPGSCAAGRQKTLQMGGNRVYWDGEAAWRCQPYPGGVARITVTGPAVQPTAFAADVAYARVAASVRRIER